MVNFKKTITALSLLGIVFLSGCKSPEAADQAEAAQQTEAADQTRTAQTAEAVEQPLYPMDQKSCVIQEDEGYIYVCGLHRLVKIDKESGESEVLWDNQELSDDDEMDVYYDGSGLLINDKIYFVEEWTEKTESSHGSCRTLSVIHTDGTGYERVEPILETIGSVTMLLQDGSLYIEDAEENVVYHKVYEDGTLSEAEYLRYVLSETMNQEVSEADSGGRRYHGPTYYDNGSRTLFMPESMKKFGGVILQRSHALVKMLPETGEEIDIIDMSWPSLRAFNSRYFLVSSYSEGSYLVDMETMEGKKLADFQINVITMDEDYIYTETKRAEEGQTWQVYEKISLETGGKSVIFRQEEIKTAYFYVWDDLVNYDLIDTVVKNGYLYYMGEADYKLYLMRRNVEDPAEEEILGEAFYDSGISEVGSLEVYHESIDKTGRFIDETRNVELVIDIDLKWLQVDERFPGAAVINEELAEAQRQNIAYEKQWLEDLIEEDVEEEPEMRYYYSYTSELPKIFYFDNRYISFCQLDKNYMGGAHDLPYKTGYTFDLQTGARLMLEDVIANSEEELKDIVARYFGEMISADPGGYYWEDAQDTVREWTDLESSFYLAEEGIGFYFGPYVLAPYAAGFQEVIIPYEEFAMKIPVGELSGMAER